MKISVASAFGRKFHRNEGRCVSILAASSARAALSNTPSLEIAGAVATSVGTPTAARITNFHITGLQFLRRKQCYPKGNAELPTKVRANRF
jgi:hypothetical protein